MENNIGREIEEANIQREIKGRGKYKNTDRQRGKKTYRLRTL